MRWSQTYTVVDCHAEGESGKVVTGGVFDVRVGGETIWSRKDEGRFPDIAELKQRVRDRVAPERDLGHVGRRR